MSAADDAARAQAPLSQALSFAAVPPLALYVHLPWCVRKCPYCDFNSYEQRGALPEREYVHALLRDLDTEVPEVAARPIHSVFIGGGTPSLFSGEALRLLLTGLRDRLPLAPGAEITLEANPGAVEAAKFDEFRAAGVNRLSIGVQSFRDPQLAALGRIHGAAEAERAVGWARAAGFDNINLDLMYALPGDDTRGALEDLQRAIALGPEHLSWYQLTLEPNTAFFRLPPASLPGEETVAEIERRGRALLAREGYDRYEISAYARTGRRSRHNCNYWEFGDYLGIGAGAHGKLTLPALNAIRRRAKVRNPRRFTAEAGTGGAATDDYVTAPRQAALEFLMNALRLVAGVDADTFEARAGQPVIWIGEAVSAARQRGWLVADPARLQATSAGLDRLNAVLALFC